MYRSLILLEKLLKAINVTLLKVFFLTKSRSILLMVTTVSSIRPLSTKKSMSTNSKSMKFTDLMSMFPLVKENPRR
jgi:hypothetical protein